MTEQSDKVGNEFNAVLAEAAAAGAKVAKPARKKPAKQRQVPDPPEPAKSTKPEKPALVLDLARSVRAALRHKAVTNAEVIRVLDVMITRASKTDGRSTAGQRARHAGVGRGDRTDRPDDQEVRGAMKYIADQIEAHYASSSAPLRSDREPLTMVEHLLLFVLVSVTTGGLAVPFWNYFGMKAKRKS